MTITTDHKWKQFRYRNEVPEKVLKDDFDWTNEDDHIDGFLKYRRTWYHLSEFIVDSFPFNGVPVELQGKWHAFHSDSFFSGVAIRVSDDGEEYQIATVIS